MKGYGDVKQKLLSEPILWPILGLLYFAKKV